MSEINETRPTLAGKSEEQVHRWLLENGYLQDGPTPDTALQLQQAVYDSVIERGYGAAAQGFSQESWLYHQWLKAVEELMEVGSCFAGHEPEMYQMLTRIHDCAERLFRTRLFGPVTYNDYRIRKELADAAVPLCMMAQTLNANLLRMAADKAEADKARGRSK